MEISGNNNIASASVIKQKHQEEECRKELSGMEATLLKVLFINPCFAEKLLEHEGIMESELGRKILNLIFEIYGLRGEFELSDITDSLDPMESQTFIEAVNGIIVAGNEEQVFEECINTWKRNKAVRREKELIDRISLADEETGSDSIKELTEELMKVQQEINSFGGRK